MTWTPVEGPSCSVISHPQNRHSAPETVPGGRQRGVLRCPVGQCPGEPGRPPARLALRGGPHQQGLAWQGAEVHAGDGLPAHGGCSLLMGVWGAVGRAAQVVTGIAKGHRGAARKWSQSVCNHELLSQMRTRHHRGNPGWWCSFLTCIVIYIFKYVLFTPRQRESFWRPRALQEYA